MSDNFVTEKNCFAAQKTMAQKIDEVKEKVHELQIEITALPEKLVEKLDERYANKETEKTVKWLQKTVIGAVVVALLALVIKQK